MLCPEILRWLSKHFRRSEFRAGSGRRVGLYRIFLCALHFVSALPRELSLCPVVAVSCPLRFLFSVFLFFPVSCFYLLCSAFHLAFYVLFDVYTLLQYGEQNIRGHRLSYSVDRGMHRRHNEISLRVMATRWSISDVSCLSGFELVRRYAT